ncbi:SGNH/GDSL hydrolase family protein [Actinomyces lilanjuaniae]|uniref:SGNH/GDSL hydrolase family protein n=2 Tax=Actinomyces lilanjuaniae TaxID=2321394 RepID=A0ABM6Z0U9_9ACTO|nr:SGNH/GDSL hydrolase family protein [Actinomyces lilanjuaniae]
MSRAPACTVMPTVLPRPMPGLLTLLAVLSILSMMLLPAAPAPAAVPAAPVSGQPVQPDTDNGDLLLPQGAYVALGDSYASGFGVAPYAPGTDVEDGNRCQRSTSAYAHLVSQRTGTELVFRACSGARTADFYQDNAAWEESAQLDALSVDTDLVTFSVGGNDAGFAEVLGECLSRAQQGDRGPCSTDEQLVSRVGSAIDALRGTGAREGTYSYDTLLSDVAARAPRAQVVVVGYPHMFPAQGAEGSAGRCEGVLAPDQRWIVERTDELNDVIRQAAQRHGMVFVDPSQTFAGHELCSSQPWFYGVSSQGQFHPTAEGHQAVADDIVEALEALEAARFQAG